MGIQSEINRLKNNVAGAYSAVEEMGGEMPEQMDSDNLASAIRSIPSGGSLMPDPIEVYKNTRPDGWLPMPMPQDNEMYLLFHIPDGSSEFIAFAVTCTGSYTVELGTVTDGQFVQQSTVSMASGDKYEAELFANDFGDLTSDGFKQCMIKVSGTNILTWEHSTHSGYTASADFSDWRIVEIMCKLSKGTKVACGSNGKAALGLRKLKYFSWLHENMLSAGDNMFRDCKSLISIPYLNMEKVTSMSFMFGNCNSLVAMPFFSTSNVTDVTFTFQNCSALTSLPPLDVSKLENLYGIFIGCMSISEITLFGPLVSYNNLYAFSGCSSLASVTRIDYVRGQEFDFSGCPSLQKLLFNPTRTVTAWSNVSVKNCSFTHAGLVELIDSLPTITTTHNLILTGNPGVPELTEDEKAIATGKGWALVL